MPENCCTCDLSPKDQVLIRCQNPMCPKVIDVDETEIDPERFAELFGNGANFQAPKSKEPSLLIPHDHWAESDYAPL